jgi:hypothetical protein
MQWYHRLAEVPDIDFPGSPGINRTMLLGYNLKPEVNSYDFDGRRSEFLSWHHADGTSSASPASHWNGQLLEANASPQAILQHLYEVLELPGTPSDYHFAIQGCFERLWQHRRDHPWVLKEIERLCWLDIRLVEAMPDILQFHQQDGSVAYARSIAFERLIRIYERNGYLAEALDVAQRATRFHADDSILKPLQERLARLEAEHGS